MSKYVNFANKVLAQKDLLLVTVFAVILLMMILPLPLFAMDLMITLNISASIIILLMTLNLYKPIQFSTFPSLLLVTTIFRLAISVSTTRLILIEGSAGQIVETFGSIVTGGNIVVGLVIFSIITIVQFLVITKGADRVAEVGARFTLDAMPGKQMSVDADVRAGMIDEHSARDRRQVLERESKLFGAMDGAMKFVKGDATAGLVITVINLVGGIAIGIAQKNMAFSEAAQLYSLMTIGDGLVAQIPALLISVSAGTMVTRVTNPKDIDLGSEISEQITENAKTIISSGIVIAAFGFIPGFPTTIFIFVGFGMAGLVFSAERKRKAERLSAFKSWDRMFEYDRLNWQSLAERTGKPETLHIVLPKRIKEFSNIEFSEIFDFVHDDLEKKIGMRMGYWTYEIRTDDVSEYEIYLQQNLLTKTAIDLDCVFIKCNASYIKALDIPVQTHFGGEEGVLVHKAHRNRLDEENIPFLYPAGQINANIQTAVLDNLGLLPNFLRTSEFLAEYNRSHPDLINALKENLSVNQISKVLQSLMEEQIPPLRQVKVLEAILSASFKNSDYLEILQQVRIAIGDFLTQRYAPNKFLSVILLSPSLETALREGHRKGADTTFLVMEPSQSNHIAEQARATSGGQFKLGRSPVLITQQDIRRSVFKILQQHNVSIPVLSYQEILPDTVIYPVSFIQPVETDEL